MTAEFATRIARVRQHMMRAGVQAVLFDEIESLTWLSGYGNSENRWRCVVVPLEGEPFFLIRALDATPCRARTWISDIITYRDWEDPFPLLAQAMDRRGLSSAYVGLDFNSYGMPLARFECMKSALPSCRFVDVGPLIWELRLHKSPAELALLERSAQIADEAMRRAAAACVVGGSQRDCARIAVATYVELGADPGPAGPIAAGHGWDFLHGHLDDTALRHGDVVHLELIPRVSGYSARLMRCVAVGSPPTEIRHAAERLIEWQDRQIEAMQVGARAHEVDAILRDGLLAEGLRESFDNISGYTLGFYAAAGPRTSDFTRIFHPGADWRLEADMVFHMYASAAGVSISETIHVSPQGPRRLSRLPRELFIVA